MESASPSHNSPNILQQAQTLPNPTPDNDESDVHIAATALDDMRSRGPDQTIAPVGPPAFSPKSPDPPSRLPSVINTAMKVYDYSKANSRLVSYGVGIVESSVQAISKPVIERLPNRVLSYARPDRTSSALPSQDEQQMQVDNSERYSERESSSSDPAREEQRERALSWTHEQREQMENMRQSDSGRNSASSGRTRIRGRINDDDNYDDDEPMEISSRDSWSRESQDYSLGTSSGSARFGTRPTSMTSTRNSTSYDIPDPAPPQSSSQPTQAVTRRSGWHHLMVEAGGISAAVSDESMRRLKYCLEWLQWATANLDTQINLLEAFIASINATVTGEPVSPSATVSPEALKSYMEVKRNVVNTIRQVVEVIGKYAGGSLPEPAKEKVKGFILSLPGRWSVAVKDAGVGDGWEASGGDASDTTGTSSARSPPSSTNPRKRNRLESSSQSLASESGASTNSMTIVGGLSAGSSSTNLASTSRVGSSSGAPSAPVGTKRSQLLPPTAGAARHAAHRVLTLAQESLHAVRGVTNVFKETLERAETWLDRLRRAGYSQSRRYLEDSEHGSPGGPPRLLPPSHKIVHRSPSAPISPLSSSSLDRRRTQTPRDLHLEALARSIPSVGPYGPYGSGNTPPMSPILGPTGTPGNDRKKSFPFDNPAPGAPGYGWRKNDSLAAIPSLSLDDTGRSRAGSMSMMSQYESSAGESLPPPSVIGSTSSVAGDDELDEDGEFDNKSISFRLRNSDSVVDMDGDDDEGRAHKRRKKEDETG